KKEEIATVECIRDLVEEALLANGYITTARAYIQYRERQKQERKRDLFKKRIPMKPYEYQNSWSLPMRFDTPILCTQSLTSQATSKTSIRKLNRMSVQQCRTVCLLLHR